MLVVAAYPPGRTEWEERVGSQKNSASAGSLGCWYWLSFWVTDPAVMSRADSEGATSQRKDPLPTPTGKVSASSVLEFTGLLVESLLSCRDETVLESPQPFSHISSWHQSESKGQILFGFCFSLVNTEMFRDASASPSEVKDIKSDIFWNERTKWDLFFSNA
jgi:hypothetical protein